jgi:glyoxylase-like metal-dependent hydrolase (beta-lactamase superfamily II)
MPSITHFVYSHFHLDHIGGAQSLGGDPIIIAHMETNGTGSFEVDHTG